ncbi:MAG TPA: cellulase family glycosylhydrolase [Nitrososphaeraceae archaeon]|nr:cellulase family glycosylhydrolase [Nitrososphaeraceae archaeon]
MLKNKKNLQYLAVSLILILTVSFSYTLEFKNTYSYPQNGEKLLGVNMKGKYTSLNYERFPNVTIMNDYYNDSFKLIKSMGLNHVRYVLYWEAYENNRKLFLEELESMASLADKWGLNIIYDNHQFHTSSWFDEKRGTGFPSFLFDKNIYPYNSETKSSGNATKLWWTNWWDRNIVHENNKTDGWILQANFLKTIARLLDNHNSTVGYEILNEPQIFSEAQWSKIGKYYAFMINEIRKQTNKIVVIDMTIPIKFGDPTINLTSENMVKIIPKDSKSIFKISLYGIPMKDNYQEKKLELLENVSKLAGVPLYVGEWNHVIRDKTSTTDKTDINKINVDKSDLTQNESDFFVSKFNKSNIQGWAFWNWNYIDTPPQNFNLIYLTKDGDIVPTKYFYILKNSVEKLYNNPVL